MTLTTTDTKTIKFAVVAALALGAPLEGGTFQGVITLKDGAHVAVVLLAEKPAKRLKWADAKAWAESVDGVLPTRPVAALLYATAKAQFESEWHWTSDRLDADTGDKDDASCAWSCHFSYGNQYYNFTSSAGAARAVRLIHLEG
jgi:hypothetical protein